MLDFCLGFWPAGEQLELRHVPDVGLLSAGSGVDLYPGTRRALAVGGFESLIAYYPCRYSGEGAIPLRRQDTHPKPAMTCHATTRDCSRKFPYCSVPESWLAAMLTGTFLTVTQVRSHPAQIHMPMTVDGLYLIV